MAQEVLDELAVWVCPRIVGAAGAFRDAACNLRVSSSVPAGWTRPGIGWIGHRIGVVGAGAVASVPAASASRAMIQLSLPRRKTALELSKASSVRPGHSAGVLGKGGLGDRILKVPISGASLICLRLATLFSAGASNPVEDGPGMVSGLFGFRPPPADRPACLGGLPRGVIDATSAAPTPWGPAVGLGLVGVGEGRSVRSTHGAPSAISAIQDSTIVIPIVWWRGRVAARLGATDFGAYSRSRPKT